MVMLIDLLTKWFQIIKFSQSIRIYIYILSLSHTHTLSLSLFLSLLLTTLGKYFVLTISEGCDPVNRLYFAPAGPVTGRIEFAKVGLSQSISLFIYFTLQSIIKF